MPDQVIDGARVRRAARPSPDRRYDSLIAFASSSHAFFASA